MNPFEEGEELPIEKILGQMMKGHITNVRENPQENNNSFIFLEKSSLNLLLTYLLSRPQNETSSLGYEEFEASAIEHLNQMINENEKEFNAIINLLKEVT